MPSYPDTWMRTSLSTWLNPVSSLRTLNSPHPSSSSFIPPQPFDSPLSKPAQGYPGGKAPWKHCRKTSPPIICILATASGSPAFSKPPTCSQRYVFGHDFNGDFRILFPGQRIKYQHRCVPAGIKLDKIEVPMDSPPLTGPSQISIRISKLNSDRSWDPCSLFNHA